MHLSKSVVIFDGSMCAPRQANADKSMEPCLVTNEEGCAVEPAFSRTSSGCFSELETDGSRVSLSETGDFIVPESQPPPVAPEAGSIWVTRPYLPELGAFVECLEQIWSSRKLTNDGPFHHELESSLADYLGVPYISLFCNATVALTTILKALDITGEVITTPFSFPASSHSLSWCGLTPVFCDIEPDSYTLDPEKIERCIGPRTRAILPVHVYGYPCRVEEIAAIADKHKMPVVYDAAHAFGVGYKGQSLLNYGDAAVLSFHATKIFNTFEGGAVICRRRETKERLDILRNHGIVDEVTVAEPGTNGKMNELQAAIGVLQLRDLHLRVDRLRAISRAYRSLLSSCLGIRMLPDLTEVKHNYSYFPVLIDEDAFGCDRDFLSEVLKSQGIFARRYFFPLISALPAYRGLSSADSSCLQTAERVSRQVLCLPNYAEMELNVVERVCHCIRSVHADTRS